MVCFISHSRISSCITFPDFLLQPTMYVKGFALDWAKIQKLVNAKDENDLKVHDTIRMIMRDFVDRDNHWVCSGLRIHDKKFFGIISLGEGSLSEDLEELQKKDIPVPEYLAKMTSVLTGPEVFEFLNW